MSKKINIHVSRRITVSRPGQEPVVLEPGRNAVDEEIARHPYVKHFLTDEPTAADNAEADALRARVADLEKKLDAQESAHKEFFDAAVAERQAQAARVTELEEQLAQKTADLDALVASMSAPAETGAKGKGK